jgi:hypothetical protein
MYAIQKGRLRRAAKGGSTAQVAFVAGLFGIAA